MTTLSGSIQPPALELQRHAYRTSLYRKLHAGKGQSFPAIVSAPSLIAATTTRVPAKTTRVRLCEQNWRLFLLGAEQ